MKKQMEFEPAVSNINQATEFLEEALSEVGAPMKVIMQTNIALDEIFSNIIYYSGATRMILECEIEDNHMIIQFSDDGKPYDPTGEEDPDITLSAEERGIGGLGILMVKKSMDDVKYKYADGFNVLSLYKSW